MKAGDMAGTLGHLLLEKARGGKRLLSLYFLVTERCPNTCTYCGYRDSVGDRGLMAREMPLEQIRGILREAAAMGCRRLHLSGGEPLARADIGGIVDAAKEAGMFAGISTSGVGLPARIEGLGGLDIAFVSLDGPEEIHNRNRGRADFAAAVHAIEMFQAKGKKVFTTTVLNRHSVQGIDFMLDFARTRGILANFVFCNYHLDPKEESHLPKRPEVEAEVLSPEEMRGTLERLRSLKRGGAPVGSSSAYFDYLASWRDYEVPYDAKPHAGTDCSAGRFYAYLFPDGRLYSCGDLYWRQESRSVPALGLRQAFETLPPIPCRSCRTACYIEQNLVYGLDVRAGANWLGMKLKGRW